LLFLQCALLQHVQTLVYGGQAAFDDTVKTLQAHYSDFEVYIRRNWLPIKDMFASHERRGVMHMDNHTNNRLERSVTNA